MRILLKLALPGALACLIASCAAPNARIASQAGPTSATGTRRMANVRTTAYTHTERGGRHNALGSSLSGRNVMSAASDWSRFPLGTRFQIVGAKEQYVIDDYGSALIGTSTIDLYKTSRLNMRRWGVRRVDIDILEWGSKQHSLEVLAPRKKHQIVRRMIAALEANKS